MDEKDIPPDIVPWLEEALRKISKLAGAEDRVLQLRAIREIADRALGSRAPNAAPRETGVRHSKN